MPNYLKISMGNIFNLTLMRTFLNLLKWKLHIYRPIIAFFHRYIDLQNIPENKYYSMDQNPDEEEKL